MKIQLFEQNELLIVFIRQDAIILTSNLNLKIHKNASVWAMHV